MARGKKSLDTPALASCRSPTALKRPDKWKQCHCLQFAKCIDSLLHLLKKLIYTVTTILILQEKMVQKKQLRENTSVGLA